MPETADPFDPVNLARPDHMIPVRKVPSSKERRRLKYFVAFPEPWIAKLAEAKASASAYRVAIYLLRRRQITGNRTIGVSNIAVRNEGVGRKGKDIALKELAAAGLVVAKRRSKKSPIVTLKLEGV